MSNVLFNAHKHHQATMLDCIKNYIQSRDLAAYLKELENWGIHRPNYNGIIDIYEGKFSIADIESEVFQFQKTHNILDRESYQQYLETHGECKRIGYYVMFKLSDKTVLTLRTADQEQFVHVHPGRYSPNTYRVKANTLKTCLVAKYLSLTNQKEICLDTINEARSKLDLSPIAEIPEAIGEVFAKLSLSTES